MIPLALKIEEGAESRAPMAVVIIGGVISSLLLTLFLVPSVYTILVDISGGFKGFLAFPKRRRMQPAMGAPPPPSPVSEPGDDD